MAEGFKETFKLWQVIKNLNDIFGEWTGIKNPTETTTNLTDVNHAINTSAFKVEGFQVFDSTADIPMFATGDTDASTWVGEKAGSTITVSPV